MPQVDAHVGDRTSPVPGQELRHARPGPRLADGAVEGDELGGVLVPLGRQHRCGRETVRTADPLGDTAAQRHLAGHGDAVVADVGAAESPVVVRVHEPGRQHPALAVDGPLGASCRARRYLAELHQAVTLDQRVARVGLGHPVAVYDHDVGQQLANGHQFTVPANPLRARAGAVESSGGGLPRDSAASVTMVAGGVVDWYGCLILMARPLVSRGGPVGAPARFSGEG